RHTLGTCFRFASKGHDKRIDMRNPIDRANWIKVHGKHVVDFGSGLMHDTAILRNAGIRVASFEPFHVPQGHSEPHRETCREIAREFLDHISQGQPFTSVYLQAILNSVPLEEDRIKVLAVCHALCSPGTRLFSTAVSQSTTGYHGMFRERASQQGSSGVGFLLDYEPRTRITEIAEAPKVQHYFTLKEWKGLFELFFEDVKVSLGNNN